MALYKMCKLIKKKLATKEVPGGSVQAYIKEGWNIRTVEEEKQKSTAVQSLRSPNDSDSAKGKPADQGTGAMD